VSPSQSDHDLLSVLTSPVGTVVSPGAGGPTKGGFDKIILFFLINKN